MLFARHPKAARMLFGVQHGKGSELGEIGDGPVFRDDVQDDLVRAAAQERAM